MDATPGFLEQLLAQGILVQSGVNGLYGRGATFEDVLLGIDALITRASAAENAEVFRFPPVMSRVDFEASGYMRNFPRLAATVHSFCGDEHAHREMLRCFEVGADWTAQQAATDVVLTPAACYPLYPILSRRGCVPPDGWCADVMSFCFRREPSLEPTRMQSFRMREMVRVGAPQAVLAFRASWLTRIESFMATLGLPFTLDVANDPFFGRAGRLLAESQRAQEFKFEALVAINSTAQPTACVSFNYHMDHFNEIWPLRLADGRAAHTACVAFGLERLALAALRNHGLDTAAWPDAVRAALWPVASR